MDGITFLLGGVRSGKSSLAVDLGRRHETGGGAVVFVACAEPFDDDMRARIDRHRLDRPAWPTIEAPVELAGTVSDQAPQSLLIVDCLTVWIANLHHHDRPVEPAVAAFVDALVGRPGPAVVVSNEVGMGLHPMGAASRRYGDDLGRLNQAVAQVARTSLLLVAGRAVRLDEPSDLL